MSVRGLCAATAAAVVLAPGASGAAPAPPPAPAPGTVWYTVVDLGRLGYSGSPGDVTAVNDDGVATGYVVDHGTDVARTWPGNELPMPGYLASHGLAINASGTVAGAAAGCPNGCPNGTMSSDGAVWKSGRLHVVAPLIHATGINDSGLVVGFDSVGGLGTRAVAWRDGSLLTLAPLAEITNAYVAEAHAVDNAGVVVGRSLLAEPGIEHAFAVDVGPRRVAPTVDLGTLPAPFDESNAFGINDRGDIVGASSVGFGSHCHAVMWLGRTIVDLGALAPGSWGGSAALGINEADEVVGFAGGNDPIDGVELGATAAMRAVLWHNGVALDLNDMISGGWQLSVAHDVNNRGEIVGSGFRQGDSVPHGFMLVARTRLASLAVSPSAVRGGRLAHATVTLTRAAPPGGETIFVTSSFPHPSPADIPDVVTVPQGQTAVTFPIPTSVVKRAATGTVTVTFDGEARSARLTVQSGTA